MRVRAQGAAVVLEGVAIALTLAQVPFLVVLPVASLGVFARVHAMDVASAFLTRPGGPPRRNRGEQRRLALVAAAAFGALALVAASVESMVRALAADEALTYGGIAVFGIGTMGVAHVGVNVRRWSEGRSGTRAFLDSLPPPQRVRYSARVAGLWTVWAALGAGYAFSYETLLLALAVLALPFTVGRRRLAWLLQEKDQAVVFAAAARDRPSLRLNLMVLGFSGLYLVLQWPFLRPVPEDFALVAGSGIVILLGLLELRWLDLPRTSPWAVTGLHLALGAWQLGAHGDTPFTRGVLDAVPAMSGTLVRRLSAFVGLAFLVTMGLQAAEHRRLEARSGAAPHVARRDARRMAWLLRVVAVGLYAGLALLLQPAFSDALGATPGMVVTLLLVGTVAGLILWNIGKWARHEDESLRQ